MRGRWCRGEWCEAGGAARVVTRPLAACAAAARSSSTQHAAAAAAARGRASTAAPGARDPAPVRDAQRGVKLLGVGDHLLQRLPRLVVVRRRHHKLLNLFKLVHAAGRASGGRGAWQEVRRAEEGRQVGGWGGGGGGSRLRRGQGGRAPTRLPSSPSAPVSSQQAASAATGPAPRAHRKMPVVSRPWLPASLRKHVEYPRYFRGSCGEAGQGRGCRESL